MTQSGDVYVSLEFTPNPNTLKYSINRVLLSDGMLKMTSASEATHRSPLAEKLFAIPGISAVLIAKDYLTITKSEEGDWDTVHQRCAEIIETYFKEGKPAITDQALAELREKAARGPSPEDQEIEKKVRDFLETEIRPALAMDGGDIEFQKFEDGIVYVRLEGACRGCPGARMTLKMGVERRLCEAISAVREVVAV